MIKTPKLYMGDAHDILQVRAQPFSPAAWAQRLLVSPPNRQEHVPSRQRRPSLILLGGVKLLQAKMQKIPNKNALICIRVLMKNRAVSKNFTERTVSKT